VSAVEDDVMESRHPPTIHWPDWRCHAVFNTGLAGTKDLNNHLRDSP
jgi:hypothetical protein